MLPRTGSKVLSIPLNPGTDSLTKTVEAAGNPPSSLAPALAAALHAGTPASSKIEVEPALVPEATAAPQASTEPAAALSAKPTNNPSESSNPMTAAERAFRNPTDPEYLKATHAAAFVNWLRQTLGLLKPLDNFDDESKLKIIIGRDVQIAGALNQEQDRHQLQTLGDLEQPKPAKVFVAIKHMGSDTSGHYTLQAFVWEDDSYKPFQASELAKHNAFLNLREIAAQEDQIGWRYSAPAPLPHAEFSNKDKRISPEERQLQQQKHLARTQKLDQINQSLLGYQFQTIAEGSCLDHGLQVLTRIARGMVNANLLTVPARNVSAWNDFVKYSDVAITESKPVRREATRRLLAKVPSEVCKELVELEQAAAEHDATHAVTTAVANPTNLTNPITPINPTVANPTPLKDNKATIKPNIPKPAPSDNINIRKRPRPTSAEIKVETRTAEELVKAVSFFKMSADQKAKLTIKDITNALQSKVTYQDLRKNKKNAPSQEIVFGDLTQTANSMLQRNNGAVDATQWNNFFNAAVAAYQSAPFAPAKPAKQDSEPVVKKTRLKS